MNKIFVVLILMLFISCDFLIPEVEKDTGYNKEVVPYDLQNPDKIIALPDELREISGLSYTEDDKLLAVNDEDGFVYELSEDGKINKNIPFDKGGDYEGVAATGNLIYVLKATGHFYQVNQKKIYNTPLSRKNDAEGFTYNKNDHSLLIACKEKAGIEQDLNGKAIYKFDLSTNALVENPYLIIDQKELNEFIRKRDPDLEIVEFKPSGIAVHPVSQQIYILAHNGKALAVFNKDLNLSEVVKLNQEHYKQPEGICFSNDGKKLYISNEGRGGRANLLIFSSKR